MRQSTENKISIIKSLSLIIVTVNFIFVLIINIILTFFQQIVSIYKKNLKVIYLSINIILNVIPIISLFSQRPDIFKINVFFYQNCY